MATNTKPGAAPDPAPEVPTDPAPADPAVVDDAPAPCPLCFPFGIPEGYLTVGCEHS